MAIKKSAGKGGDKTKPSAAAPHTKADAAEIAKTSARSTVSGPAAKAPREVDDPAVTKAAATNALVAAIKLNPNKAAEYGEAALEPQEGATASASHPSATGSTLTENNPSPKTGEGRPPLGINPLVDPLDRVRVDGTGQRLTTNQGVPVADNQHSLKAGLRGPALLEDFILREKITHFDHERIPERIVHARGSAAHGYFECTAAQTELTRAAPFTEAGKRTPVFVRFSTVVGERGSADTPRDVRGFAVKFYTEEGNWDLVGNNIPVFFIQDAMKFPDLIHAAKPEPHFGIPQAATAHDTFWDFVSLMPESTHMLMWAMSDRTLPRSYRMMQGFGVHTFRLVNAEGESTFVKFHWRPIAGVHALDWDESVKICGADPDFHRRDLWEAIEAGAYPEWELCFQTFTEEQAEAFTFDILDATKLVPEELAPLKVVGKMVLNRNPDNFFAETEQVAFCTAHVVPGIDFTNDPLLAGRIHSYVDTQISRLGGPNFHEIPINAPIAPVQNNQREGLHRQAIHRGRVAYEPNSLAGGCPFQAGAAGFTSFREPIEADKVRGKPERFADHFTQATLFYKSQTPVERAHIIRGFRFELTKVQTPAIRKRVVSMLANVDEDLAETLADELGMDMPEPMPRAMAAFKPEVEVSPALSIASYPGDGSIATRKVAILVADGVDAETAMMVHETLSAQGAVPRFVGPRLGLALASREEGDPLEVEVTLETTPSVLWDAVVVPGGEEAVTTLSRIAHSLDFLKEQHRHAKPILAFGHGARLVAEAGVPAKLPSGDDDPGVILVPGVATSAPLDAFATLLGSHRLFARQTDPPAV